MKVLLISPLHKLDPPCGDITYTQTLLAHPPAGVEYETYAEALARGTLQEHGTGRALKASVKARRDVAGEFALTAIGKAISLLRERRRLFWEPFRFFSVRPGEYDAIHLHVFSARFSNLNCPLVVSSGSPQRYLYTEAREYSERQTDRMEKAEVRMAKVLGINANSYYLPQTSRLMVYTQFAKSWYTDRAILPASLIDINPIFLPSSPLVVPSPHPTRIGFIAKDFAAKGGPTLLQAFEQVRAKRPGALLHIVGCPAQMGEAEAVQRGVTWTAYVPRETLMNKILPTFDVFAYPTHLDCISYVMLEAMSRGIAVATSDYPSMPETVNYGKAGLVSSVGDVEALATNILTLLEPKANAHYRCAARRHFEETYSADAVRPRLRASYEAAINQNRRAPQ